MTFNHKQPHKNIGDSFQREFIDHFALIIFTYFSEDPFEFLRGQEAIDTRLNELNAEELRQAKKEILMLLLFAFNHSCTSCDVPFRVDGVKIQVCEKLKESGFFMADEVTRFIEDEQKKGLVYINSLDNSRGPGSWFHFTREVEKIIFGHFDAGPTLGAMPLQMDTLPTIYISAKLGNLFEGNKTAIAEFMAKAKLKGSDALHNN